MGIPLHPPLPKKTGHRRGTRIYRTVFIPKEEYENVKLWEQKFGRKIHLQEYNLFIKGKRREEIEELSYPKPKRTKKKKG